MQYGTAPQSRPMMTIQESVKTCLRKYADFSGRATRAEYWWWVLATFIVNMALGVVDAVINVLLGAVGEFGVGLLGSIFGLAILLPNLAVTARRLHDIGKSGWWQLVWFAVAAAGLIPLAAGAAVTLVEAYSGSVSWEEVAFWIPIIIGALLSVLVWIGLFIWWLVWMVRQGQAGPNQHGPDPRAWDNDAVV